MREEFIARIIAWNMQRYDQKFDHTLTFNLLQEEVKEFAEAEHSVDKLDALIDMTYIALGAMWKMGLSQEQIEDAIHVVCDSNASKTATWTPIHIKANIDKGKSFIPPEPRLQEILDECK